jgi:hypothetical protein
MKTTFTTLKQPVSDMTNFEGSNEYLHHVIIGQLLGGANVTRRSPTRNSYFRCAFGTGYQAYGAWLCKFFDGLTNKGLTSRKDSGFGGSYTRHEFQTKTLPIFNYYHSLFYTLDSGKYVKVVPVNIYSLMSEVVLAHLLMSSGNYHAGKNMMEINTYSFSYEDCVRLADSINGLNETLDAVGSVAVAKERDGKDGREQYRLTIHGPYAQWIVKDLVYRHMHYSMLYRIGVDIKTT